MGKECYDMGYVWRVCVCLFFIYIRGYVVFNYNSFFYLYIVVFVVWAFLQSLYRSNDDGARYHRASHHRTKITFEKIADIGWEYISCLSYSPDLEPSDYHLSRASLLSRIEIFQKIWRIGNYFFSIPLLQSPRFLKKFYYETCELFDISFNNNKMYVNE